ncbi:MAG: porin family protein [Gemmatimonadaceae bacterium]|nr:porin family protein [Gemmatimonadaceae bacterium]
MQRTHPTWSRLAVGLALSVAGAPVAQAQAGPFVGIQYSGSSVSVKDAANDLKFGSGFGLHAGLAGSRWAVLANFDRSVLTRDAADVTLTQYDALARLTLLGSGSPFQLYATGGATGRSASKGTDFKSIAPTGGAGVQLFVTPHIALNGTALWTYGNLTRANQLSTNAPAGTYTSTQTRVNVGVSIYPLGR